MGAKYHDADWLRGKYHGEKLTMYEIADMCDVTPTTISSWMDKHNIPVRSQEDAQQASGKHTDREWLAQQYHGKGRTLKDIGKECDVTAATVMKWMDKFDIPRREATDHVRKEPASFVTLERGYERVSSKSNGSNSHALVHQLVAIANGANPYAVFSDGDYQCHHRNHIPWDNRPENIEVLSEIDHANKHWPKRERADTGEFL